MTQEQQEELEEHVLYLKYFWEEKGDMERYCHFEEIKPLIEEQYTIITSQEIINGEIVHECW